MTYVNSYNDDDTDSRVVNQFISGFPVKLSNKLKLLHAGKHPKLNEVLEAARDLVPDPACVLAA